MFDSNNFFCVLTNFTYKSHKNLSIFIKAKEKNCIKIIINYINRVNQRVTPTYYDHNVKCITFEMFHIN